jgi:xanthine dehydrogenase YagR molybdenum-binding subunit
VSCAAHDLGTGAYTVLGQIAAEVLGVPDANVRVLLGVSNLPSGPVAGGSVTTGSAGSAVHLAALQVRDALAAGETGSIERTAEWKPGAMSEKDARGGLDGGMAFAGPQGDTHASYSFGAQFAEVRIDPLLRTIRVSRMVGVFACGRIINPRTARSNLMGGMVWGASFALHEESHVDRHRARFSNTDLASYHVSSNADIGEVTVETIHEDDTVVNAIGAKAVGEVGIVGMPAAIANAVYHATGVRVRKTPILVEDLL